MDRTKRRCLKCNLHPLSYFLSLLQIDSKNTGTNAQLSSSRSRSPLDQYRLQKSSSSVSSTTLSSSSRSLHFHISLLIKTWIRIWIQMVKKERDQWKYWSSNINDLLKPFPLNMNIFSFFLLFNQNFQNLSTFQNTRQVTRNAVNITGLWLTGIGL